MGEQEERRELSEGLREGELLSPCSTDRELGRSSRDWVVVEGGDREGGGGREGGKVDARIDGDRQRDRELASERWRNK